MGHRIIGVQFDGALELSLGGHLIFIETHDSQGSMSFSKFRLKRNSLGRVPIREREVDLRSPADPITIRQSGVREGKSRILAGGLLKVTRCFVNRFRVPLAPEIASPEISLVSR